MKSGMKLPSEEIVIRLMWPFPLKRSWVVIALRKSRTCTEEVIFLIVDEKMKGVVKTNPRLVSVMK
jgi:hypothetical protein